MTTPRDAGFRVPAEWASHSATWVAWPSHPHLWQRHLEGARAAVAELVAAIGGEGQGETVNVLVPDEDLENAARRALPEAGVRLHRVPFGDIWLRDTAPIFAVGPARAVASVRFAFNGWGGKYVLEHDDHVAETIASLAGGPTFSEAFVLEGGAVDFDGEGTLLTTRQCMLNSNRNGRIAEADVEAVLRAALGVDKVLWFGEGLKNDHTDGHVDTLVRFVRGGVVVAMEPAAGDDPNGEVLRALLRDARALTDARGRRVEVVTIPSPGRIVDEDCRVMPASYVNFYVSNAAVVVPTYGAPNDDEAVERIGALFPGRRAVGIDARSVLSGGGAFHCITQQQPQGFE